MKKVVLTVPVEIALRTLGEEDRQRVMAWFDSLKNWDGDDFVRTHSHKLSSPANTYVLHTGTDIRLFFTIERDTIVVLDVAKLPAILTSGSISG